VSNPTAAAGVTAPRAAMPDVRAWLWPGVRVGRIELVAALLAFATLFALIATLKDVRVLDMRGDSAIFMQAVDNINARGAAVSGVFANAQAYLESGLLTQTAEQLAKDPLQPPADENRSVLGLHADYVLYPIALLARAAGVQTAIALVYALSYTGLLLAAYLFLRARGVPIAGALLFALMIVSHPAWGGTIWGQFYPDRLFVLLGFLFMCAVSTRTTPAWLLVLAAFGCGLVNERGAAMAALFAGAYAVLYWPTLGERRNVLFAIAGVLGAYSWAIHNYVIEKSHFDQFLPGSVADVQARFADPAFAGKARLFSLINALALVLAAFEWRALVIAVLCLLPNLLGNIGGAEKTGWLTHYHSFYLPAVFWAAAVGYAALYRRVTSAFTPALAAAPFVLALVLSAIDPNSYAPIAAAPSNVANNFVLALGREAPALLGPSRAALSAIPGTYAAAVPEHTVVTTGESAMPFLFHDRVLRYYPVGIDTADYAVLDVAGKTGERLDYVGAVSYLGPDEKKKIDAMLLARMRRDGYDLDHPVAYFPATSVAVVKRKHG
jgi:hypothetical protein